MQGSIDLSSCAENAKSILAKVDQVLYEKLSENSSLYLHPENKQIVSAGWLT